MLNFVQGSDALSTFAEIGVVLLMFTTGLGTNIKELLKAGPIATFIACVGVFVPLVGGTLLYSTCTVNPDENEEVVDAFLRKNPSFEKKEQILLLPQENGTDGFFICVMKRSESLI